MSAFTSPSGSKRQKLDVADAPAALLQTAPAVEDLADEEHAAPPSTASGAHAKPLSVLFSGLPSSQAGGGPKGKGKGKLEDKEGFESVLARLQEGSESLGLLLVAVWCHCR